jgi:hypothetical protein
MQVNRTAANVPPRPAGATVTGEGVLAPAAPFAALDDFEAEALALILDTLAQSSWRCLGRKHPMTVEFWGLADEIRGRAA